MTSTFLSQTFVLAQINTWRWLASHVNLQQTQLDFLEPGRKSGGMKIARVNHFKIDANLNINFVWKDHRKRDGFYVVKVSSLDSSLQVAFMT